MDYPFIVQAWIYQGDYRPSPPHPPFLSSIPGAAQCCTLPLHCRVPPTAPTPFPGHRDASAPLLFHPSTLGAVTPLLKITKAGQGVMQKSVSSRSCMGAEFLGDGGLVPRCPSLLSSCDYFALPDAVSWTGIITIQTDTLLQFSFSTGLIVQSWWLVTLNILHTSTESLGAAEGFDCAQGSLHDAEAPHTYRFDELIPSLTLFAYCMHLYICMCMHNHTHTFYYQGRHGYF